MLNIEAIRNPEAMEDSSITAGVKVVGLADSPEVKVFSEPAMSQNNALSYILTGRSLDSSGDNIPPCGIPFVGVITSLSGITISAFSISLMIQSNFLSWIPKFQSCLMSFA